MGRLGDINGNWAKAVKVQIVVYPIVGTIILGVLGWLCVKQYDDGERMAVVEQDGAAILDLQTRIRDVEISKFTAAGGLRIWEEISRLQVSIAKLPTDWFSSRLDLLEANQDKMVARQEAMAARIESNTGLLQVVVDDVRQRKSALP